MKNKFVIRTNQTARTDKDGKRYIIDPITKERIYEFIPPLVQNVDRTMLADLKIIPNLYPKIEN